MQRMGLTELAVLFNLHAVRHGLFVLGRAIVPLLALSAGQSDSRSHLSTSNFSVMSAMNTTQKKDLRLRKKE